MTIKQIPSRQLDLGPLQHFDVQPESPPGNQVIVQAGWLKNEKVLIVKAQQTTVAFLPTASTNQVRWDLVYLDLLGNANVLSGVDQPSSVPEFTGAPDPPPYSYPLAYIMVHEAGAVTVIEGDITRLRPQFNFLFDSDYSNTYCISAGDKPHTAIGKLSQEVEHHQAYTGKSIQGAGGVMPSYSSLGAPEYTIADGVGLTAGIAQGDAEHNRQAQFMGKDTLIETSPNYPNNYHTTPGSDLRGAIAELDAYLNANVDPVLPTTNQKAALVGPTGYPPSGTDVYPTMDWVLDQISSSGAVKRAWGSSNPPSNINLDTGSITNGTYNGDTGFSITPGVIASLNVGNWSDDHHHGWDIDINNLDQHGFDIAETNYGGSVDRINWLAVGR